MNINEKVEWIRNNKNCETCDGNWCFENCTLEERNAYAAKYGCICGVCCIVCKQFRDCFPKAPADVKPYFGPCKECQYYEDCYHEWL